MDLLSYDADGLPRIFLREDEGLKRVERTCEIRISADGATNFLHTCREDDVDNKSVILFLIGAIAGVTAGTFLSWPLRDAVPPTVVMLTLLVAGGVLGFKMGGRLLRRLKVGVRDTARGGPWISLKSFYVTSDQEYLGAERKDADGKDIEPKSVVVADFGGVESPIVVSVFRTKQESTGLLHQLLTREFIERRAGHLERLASQAQRMRAEEGITRRKLI